MYKYPESLPLFEMGWSTTPQISILESTPERGPSKRRRLTTSKTDILTGTCMMNSTQLATFIDFWENKISDGVDQFEYPDFVYSNEYRTARFKGSYSFIKEDENLYQLSIELEMLP